MTIKQRRRKDSVTKRKTFMISDEQEAKKHEAAQILLFQMSDVQSELYKKKQHAASRKKRAVEPRQKKMHICAETYDQPRIRGTQINKMIEEAPFVNKEKAQDFILEGENVNAEFDQLLLLANSAELLESEGQFDLDKSMEGAHWIGDVEVEKGAFRIRGKVRLTRIRNRARLGNLQREGADFERLEDAHGGKSAEVDQVQGMMHHENVQDPCIVTKRGSEDIKGIRKHLYWNTTSTDNLQQLSVNEPMNLNSQILQESYARTHVIVPPPVERDPEFGDLGEQDSGVHPLIEVGTATMSASNDNKLSKNLQQPTLEIPVPVQMYSELAHCRDQQSSGHQLTKVIMDQRSHSKEDNLNENSQQSSLEPHESIPQPVQMTPELGDYTEQESVTNLFSKTTSLLNKSLNTQKEINHALNDLTKCSSSLIQKSSIQKSEVVKRQKSEVVKKRDYPARYKGKSKRPPVAWLQTLKGDPSVARHRRMLRITKRIVKRRKMSAEGLNISPSVARDRRMLRISERKKKAVQRTSELGEIKEQDTGAQPLMQVEFSEMSNPKESCCFENLQKAAVDLHAIIPQGVQTSDLGDLREKQNNGHLLTEVRTEKLSLSKENNLSENLQQPSAEPHVSIPLPVQMTAELGGSREKNSSAHLLTEVETSKMSPLLKKNLNPQQEHGHPPLNNSTECSSAVLKDSDSTKRRKGRRKRLPVVQKSEVKDDPSITRHRRTIRIIERRKQRHGTQISSTANMHMTPVCQDPHWGMWHVLNAQQYEQTHTAKQQCPSNVSYAETEQQCLTSEPKKAERIEDQRALEASLQQSNIPPSMKQSRLEEQLQNPRMDPSEEQASLSVEVNQSLQHHCITGVCEDHHDELQQPMTNVGDENRNSFMKPKMRLTRLKHEARLKHSPLQLKN